MQKKLTHTTRFRHNIYIVYSLHLAVFHFLKHVTAERELHRITLVVLLIIRNIGLANNIFFVENKVD